MENNFRKDMMARFNITETCDWYLESRNLEQRIRHMELDKAPLYGYETRGCYKCDGLNKDCPAYINILEIYYEMHDM